MRSRLQGALLIAVVALLVVGSMACQKKEPSKALNDLVAPPAHAAPIQVAKAEVPALTKPSAALKQQEKLAEGEAKLAARPVEPKETPKMSVASSGDETDPEILATWDPERPLPGEGRMGQPGAITMADPALEIVTSELDPNIPLNMRPVGGMPQWMEEIEESIRAKELAMRGDDDGPVVDLSLAPYSSLQPAPNDDPECRDERSRDEALAPYGTISFQSYPASSPTGGPPDVHLTVGRDYVIAGYNSYFVVYNKGTGTQAATFNMTSLYSGLTNCGSGNVCDPQVLYDDFNGGSCPSPTDPRYILVALWVNAAATDSRICIACSKSATNPTSTGNFWKYEWDPAGTGVADYPKIGAGPDALIIGHNWFGTGYGAAAAISKSNLYAGTTPTIREYTFAPASTYRTPWPAVRVGCKQSQTPTYSGTHLTTSTGTSLQLWRWPTPQTSSNPVTYGSASLSATNCSNPTGAYIATTPLDCFPTAWQSAEQRGDYLFTTRSATGGAGSGIQWAKINVSGGTPTTHSNGTVTETGNYLWMPSITSDKNNDFAVGFSRASQTNSIRASGAVAGSEGGTWGSVLVAKAGEVAYNSGVTQSGAFRWGDYSGMRVDPEDGCTLWSNTQYARNDTLDDGSWIATYKFASCSPGPTPYLNSLSYGCFSPVVGTIIDTGGAPTNAVYHASNGNVIPGVISGGPNNFTVSPTTVSALGAADGNTIWLSITGSDLANHNSSSATVGCALNLCVSSIPALTGGCDNDGYMDRGETLNIFPQFINNESFTLPTGFKADLRVNPSFPDANITIVTGTAEYDALDVGAIGGPVGVPFQVRCTGGTDIRTVNFELYNIRATDGSWTGGSGCGAGNLLFTEIANANNSVGASFSGFPESFDGATFPPTNWTQVDTSGDGTWARSASTSHASPTATPHSGAGLAFFNSWTVASGVSTRLQRTTNVNTTGIPLAGASFWMYHDTQYTNIDTVQLQVSTDGGTTWVAGGPLVERRVASSPGWTNHVADISALAGNQATVRVGFHAVGGYGNDCHIDDVNFFQLTRVADASTCSGAPVISLSSQTYGSGYFLADTQCNANGYADAGDFGTLLVYLANTGNEDAYGVTATLTCPTCPVGVTICKATANYGTIPYSSGYTYSAPDNGFQVAIPTGLAAGTALPWVVTVAATNPYSTTLNIPTNPPQQSRSGTFAQVTNGDPYGYSIADYVGVAPGTAGATDRYGFSTAWTVTSGVTRSISSDFDGNGASAQLRGRNTSTPQSMAHTFSTAGVDGTINNYWIFDIGAATTARLYLEFTNDGTNWLNVIPSGTGIAGNGGGAGQWTTYGYFSLYWQVYNQTAAGYGPATANALLNNPSFGMRVRCTYTAATYTNFYADAFWMDFFRWQNTATSCTGVCRGPDAPTVSEVRDINPCSLTGVQVYFDKGLGTVSTDLYRDGGSVVTGYTSGNTYTPGDSSSHNYTVRAINTVGNTDSAPAVAGTDATNAFTPTITCSPGACTHASLVTLTTEQGMSGYQWYRNGTIISGANTYSYGATLSGNYTVVYTAGACSANTSAIKAVTVSGGASPERVAYSAVPTTLGTTTGTDGVFTWDSGTTGCTSPGYHILYGLGANIATLDTASPVVTGSRCSIGTTGSYTWTQANGMPSPASGNFLWFLIVGDNAGTTEGSWGVTSAGLEEGRTAASGQCTCTTRSSNTCSTP